MSPPSMSGHVTGRCDMLFGRIQSSYDTRYRIQAHLMTQPSSHSDARGRRSPIDFGLQPGQHDDRSLFGHPHASLSSLARTWDMPLSARLILPLSITLCIVLSYACRGRCRTDRLSVCVTSVLGVRLGGALNTSAAAGHCSFSAYEVP